MADSRRFGLDEVLVHFRELEDPRSEINRKHPLASVVVIALIAGLAGASGSTAIARWAALKEEWLASVLPLPNGVPRKDSFSRVLMAVRPEAFQACFAAWVRTLRDEAGAETGVERPTLAVDGKTLRRSHDRKKGLGALHSVSVWASEYGLSLGQVACDEKSNEITAIPELLRLVDVAGAVVTIDAMGCQREIAGAIVAAKGDYLLALKGNQGTLHQAVVDHVLGRWDDDFAGETFGRCQAEKTSHGRHESRTCIQLEAPKSLPGFQAWRGLKSIGVVISESVRDGKSADEVRYFLSSLAVEPDARAFAHAARSHWGVENGCHWTLDVTYREDESRLREKLLRENMAWLNRFSLSLLRQHPGRQSVAMKRRSCGWSNDFLMQVVKASIC
ncbi:ISAs1 family transposase [Tundrisphaera lichenicola]|uniref:ISAs1 family transposase n=1 Tax=Tundrisphaera lichenicola TaxID=2029860 RepID=UPI003EB95344